MLQIILTLAIFLILIIPMGKYMYHIATEQKTFADKVFDSVDRLIYKVCGIKGENMGWKTYALTLLTANAVMVFVGYLILRLQNFLFLNPNGIDGMEASLSFNTVISFMTNTNLQHYSGESGLAYVSQMCVIIFMMFTSAASGYAACMAFCRGLSGRKLGNFYRDMVRITTRILIPVSFIIALILVSQGTPQTLIGNLTIETVEGKLQDLAMGPVAALEAIKHLGTNGGGFFGANSATPFENPTVISNIVEMISMMILPGACVVTFGHMLAEKRRELKEARIEKKKIWMGRQGAVIFGAMAILFAVGLLICYNAEMAGNRKHGGKRSAIRRCAVFALHDCYNIVYDRYGQQYARYADAAWRNGSDVTYDAELRVRRKRRRTYEYGHVCDPCRIYLRTDGRTYTGIFE